VEGRNDRTTERGFDEETEGRMHVLYRRAMIGDISGRIIPRMEVEE
jgi:hypothetical protein